MPLGHGSLPQRLRGAALAAAQGCGGEGGELMLSYDEFLRRKEIRAPLAGMSRVPALGAHLFPHQRDCVEYLLRPPHLVGGDAL